MLMYISSKIEKTYLFIWCTWPWVTFIAVFCACLWPSAHILRPIIGAFTDAHFIWLKSQYLSDEDRYLHNSKINIFQRCISNTYIMCHLNLYNNEASGETDLSPYPKICNFRHNIFCYNWSYNCQYCSYNSHFCFVLHLMLWRIEKYALWSRHDAL